MIRDLVDLNTARAHGITPRQAEVLAHVAAGHTNTHIAATLFIGEETVQTLLKHAYRALGVTTRPAPAAVARAYDIGLFRTQAQRETTPVRGAA